MAYAVRLTAPAEADAAQAFEWIREVTPQRAERWLQALFAAIMTLAEMPARCPLIPEAEEIGHPARQLIFGRRTAAYRIMFDIEDESPEGPRVRVLRVWHGARAAVTAEDLEAE